MRNDHPLHHAHALYHNIPRLSGNAGVFGGWGDALTMILWLLICGHALSDYPLQGDFLARGKNHKQPIPGVPWQQCLIAHALIHGGTVTLITGSLLLGFCEYCVHCLIDYGKCDGWYGFNFDQALHIVCKVVWFILLLHGVK